MNTGPCAECCGSARHKDGCRAWETQLGGGPPKTPIPTSPIPASAFPREAWKSRFAACRQVRRLLDNAEGIAADCVVQDLDDHDHNR